VGKFVRTVVSSGKDKEKRVVGKLTQTEFPPNPTDNNLRQVDPTTALHHTTSRQPHAHARTTPTCPKGFDTFVFNMLICNFQVPPKPNILIYNYMTTRRNKKTNCYTCSKSQRLVLHTTLVCVSVKQMSLSKDSGNGEHGG
jgi:hypothetical protein